jgi:transmembrane sensor
VEEIIDILQKKLKGELFSRGDERRFELWISSSDNQKEFTELEKVWQISGTNKVLKPNVDAQWERFKRENTEPAKHSKIKPLYKYISAIAATIVMAIAIFTLVQPFESSSEIYSAVESPINIQLPDGSSVTLNINSTLTVSHKFNNRTRTVKLIGEGLFNVEKNKNVPFIVNMENDLSAKVLGTSFNLRHYSNSSTSELKVLTGKVLFQKADNNIVLEKNEEIKFDLERNKFSEKKALNSNLLAWHTKKIEFDNTPIYEAVESLERFINKSILIPENSNDIRYTGSFNNPSEKEIAEVIALALGWNYKISDEAITFSEKKTKK